MLHQGTENPWTDQRVDDLKRMWHDGCSSTQIARELGGVTRNAVIGKVHRLGLSRPFEAAKAALSQPRPRTRTGNGHAIRTNLPSKPLPAPAPIPREAPTSLDLTIDEIRSDQCHYPYGDRAPFLYCGHATAGGSWCPFHGRRMIDHANTVRLKRYG